MIRQLRLKMQKQDVLTGYFCIPLHLANFFYAYRLLCCMFTKFFYLDSRSKKNYSSISTSSSFIFHEMFMEAILVSVWLKNSHS